MDSKMLKTGWGRMGIALSSAEQRSLQAESRRMKVYWDALRDVVRRLAKRLPAARLTHGFLFSPL